MVEYNSSDQYKPKYRTRIVPLNRESLTSEKDLASRLDEIFLHQNPSSLTLFDEQGNLL